MRKVFTPKTWLLALCVGLFGAGTTTATAQDIVFQETFSKCEGTGGDDGAWNGTGVGSGVIINSNIITGVNFAGGEWGHMVIVKDGEPCGCGRHGCWEAYASATALIRQTIASMNKNPNSLMHAVAKKEGKVSGRTAFDAMRLGDKDAAEVCKQYIEYVACGVTNLINALQPEVLCIGGGICNEGETIMQPIREYVARERYSVHSSLQTKIVKAELGNDAGLIGAALLGTVKRIKAGE